MPFAITLCSQSEQMNKLSGISYLALFQQCRMQDVHTVVLHLESLESMHQLATSDGKAEHMFS